MSILINMEMPKGCLSCFLKYGSCASIRKRIDVGKGDRWVPENYRHDDCPLVQVPPHGRLIDADSFRADWLYNGANEYVYDTNSVLDSIDNAPTVIPADKDINVLGKEEDE